MNKSDVHNFWRNPDSDHFGASPKYRSICQPEHYVGFHAISEMWVSIIGWHVQKDASILELGCSVGRNLSFLKKAGYNNLTGVEINPRAKEIAAHEFGKDVADKITTASIEDYMTQLTPIYDVVFTSGVLMHIHPDSEWVFMKIAHAAQKFLMVAEVEKPTGLYKWPRNYRAIFEGFGFAQIHEQPAPSMSNRTTLRVFKRVE